jgi:uncharacterized membrane protein
VCGGEVGTVSKSFEIEGGRSTTAGAQVPPARAGDATSPPAGRRRPGWLTFTLPGSWVALIFACLSFTPSLLPRGGVAQGVIWGVTAAIGYGLGVWGAAIWRAFADRPVRPARPWAWRVFVVCAIVLLIVFFALGQYWQSQIRALMGGIEYNLALVVVSPLVAALVFLLVVQTGRGLRWLYRGAARLLRRWIGPRAASAVGWIAVVAVTYLVVSGVLLDGLVTAANDAFSTRDTTTAEGVHTPQTALRSGGTGSLIPWDTLGWQGRTFTGLGPNASDIEKLVHRPAMEPIRAYSGLASADGAEAQAKLAVQELDHQGAFRRKNLLVVTTTGSGWINAASADKSKAREAGRELFDAVYDRWSQLPAGDRPQLFVSGESLGTFGGEAAFSGEYDLRNRTAGAVLAGPPNFNTLFTQFREGRDAGSPETEPVYRGGRTVRFTNDATTAIPPSGQPWDGSRVLYLMHPSDPIVWWSPRLLLNRPDWTSETHGKDVLQGILWMPFVTFWQVTGDLTFAAGVPSGHGHTYKTEYVDAWNTVLRPTGITPEMLDTLRAEVAAIP